MNEELENKQAVRMPYNASPLKKAKLRMLSYVEHAEAYYKT